jgi:hypothetical protein
LLPGRKIVETELVGIGSVRFSVEAGETASSLGPCGLPPWESRGLTGGLSLNYSR